MTVSLVFSLTIYQLNFREVNIRLENLQHSLVTRKASMGITAISPQDRLRLDQSEQAAGQMILALVYINTLILLLGGLGSYFLARRTLEPIEKAHEAQSRFTSDASHELRTPLAAMKAELEVYLRYDTLTLGEAKELLESNLEEVEKLTKLSDMLLKMSRLDYDKLEKTQIDIVQMLPSVMKSFSKSKKRFDITARKSALIVGNEAAVSELMSILIENSLKYSPERSQISIRIFEKRMMVGFEIRNTGNPISEDDLPYIFDRFYRADSSRTASGINGYGLGLGIAKRITEIHNGYIQASSTEKETVFTFCLPSFRNIAPKIKSAHPIKL